MNSNFALNLYTALCKQSKQWKLDDWHDDNPENCYLQGLLSVVENLPESDRKVLAALYRDNLTLVAAGKKFGYSSGSHIGTLRNKIFRKLRHPKRMEEYRIDCVESLRDKAETRKSWLIEELKSCGETIDSLNKKITQMRKSNRESTRKSTKN